MRKLIEKIELDVEKERKVETENKVRNLREKVDWECAKVEKVQWESGVESKEKAEGETGEKKWRENLREKVQGESRLKIKRK